MNLITNDYGEIVAAVGAPNSKARAGVRWPKLIDRLQSLFMQQARIDTAIKEIREHGIVDESETLRILENTYFTVDACYSIVKYISRRTNDQEREDTANGVGVGDC